MRLRCFDKYSLSERIFIYMRSLKQNTELSKVPMQMCTVIGEPGFNCNMPKFTDAQTAIAVAYVCVCEIYIRFLSPSSFKD